MKFKKDDKAVMINCGEGEYYAGKVWTCKGDSFKDNNNEEVVFLEGFSGYFHCRFLTKPYKDESSVSESRDMNNRIKLSIDDVNIVNNDETLIETKNKDCSIVVIEYPDGYDEGDELDIEVHYEFDNYKIPANALRIGAQLLEIAEHKGLVNP